MTRHPNDTQYPYPTEESPFVVMKYGDGWGVYNRVLDQMVLLATGEHPFETKNPESCESLIRMLMKSMTPKNPLAPKTKRYRM